jgi:hypothetical protein
MLNAFLPSNPQIPTISAPDMAGGTRIPSTTTRRANDNDHNNGQDSEPEPTDPTLAEVTPFL